MSLRGIRSILPVLLVAVAATMVLRADDKKKDPDEIGNRKVDGRVNWYSMEREIAMGKQYAMEIERQAKIVDDPIITEYVNRVGQNIVRNSDVKVPVSIKVLETDEPNAMALPGGFFFVNTGLIKLAENEAEVAGVMGHEIAHIAARHGTRQMTKAGIANLATIPMMILGGGWAMYGIYQATNIAIPVAFLRFSRADEAEADMLGLQYMYKAGYDPNGFVEMFERLESMEKRKPGTISKVFMSHPPTGDRIVKVQSMIAQYLKEKPEYVVTTSEFDEVRDRLMMLENRRKATPDDPTRPRLRKAPGSGSPTIDGDDTSNTKNKEESDERPTLKRRD